MELELKKACFDAYEAAGELTLTQEETAETIVPDYCPDIARIIETTGKVFLHSREMRDGRAEISGTVRVTVLYTPEGEGGIRTLEFAMPFTVETDGRSLPDCAALLADTEPELLEYMLGRSRALVIESFGVGGLPERGGMHAMVKAAAAAGKAIVMTTQVQNEGSNLSVYDVGFHLKNDLHLLEAYDMTTEAVVAKLMWILGQTRDPAEIRRLFCTPVSYDLLYLKREDKA